MTERPNKTVAWSPERRSALVMRILRWDEPLEEVAKKAGVPAEEAAQWTREFVSAGEQAQHPHSAGASGPERIRDLEHKLVEMALEMDRLRKHVTRRANGPPPPGPEPAG